MRTMDGGAGISSAAAIVDGWSLAVAQAGVTVRLFGSGQRLAPALVVDGGAGGRQAGPLVDLQP